MLNTAYKRKRENGARVLPRKQKRHINVEICVCGVYEATKTLCNSQQKSSNAVKDQNGRLLITEKEVMERWKEHFTEVFNRPEPESNANITTNNINELDIGTRQK